MVALASALTASVLRPGRPVQTAKNIGMAADSLRGILVETGISTISIAYLYDRLFIRPYPEQTWDLWDTLICVLLAQMTIRSGVVRRWT